MSLRAARQAFPARLVVEDIEGPFRIQSTRSRPFSWLGDRLVTIPPYWRRPIERAGTNRIFQAEAVDGPGAEMIVLTMGEKLSVSRDVERGLLAVVTSGTLVAALFALAALIISGIPFMVFSREELTLPRYLAAGHNLAVFASAAELQKTPPRPYTRVELRNVTLACTPKGHVVAVDDIPDALLAEGGALRAELEPLVPAYEEFEHDVSNPHTEDQPGRGEGRSAHARAGGEGRGAEEAHEESRALRIDAPGLAGASPAVREHACDARKGDIRESQDVGRADRGGCRPTRRACHRNPRGRAHGLPRAGRSDFLRQGGPDHR